jgi:glycosyltransferase involved in cell wall biosynthesis
MTAALPRGAERPITVVVPLPPSYRGGTEEYAYRLVHDFSALAPTQVVTTTMRWDPGSDPLDVGQARVARLPVRDIFQRPLLLNRRARGSLWAAARASRVLQLHMPFPLVEAPAVRAAHRAGVPSVLTYHMDADLGSAEGGPGAGVVTRMYRRFSAHPALDACDAVVSNSRGYAEASPVLSRHLAKVRVIAKGVDPARLGFGREAPDRAPPGVVAGANIPADRRRILFVGRLVPYKGVPVLLDGCAQLVANGRKFTLLIAGRGPSRETLEAHVARLGLEDHVRFLGFVPDEELGDLYRYSDLVVVPSVTSLESTATALEEAVACGVPVVGTNLPGTDENVPNDGLLGRLVPPSRPAELAAAMDRMLDVPRPPRPSRIRTWGDVARDYLLLFRELGVSVDLPEPQ